MPMNARSSCRRKLSSRVAENTGRNRYVSSILTSVLLPTTCVTEVFGMNVAGMPGIHEPAAAARVMWLIVASGVVALAVFFWQRLR